MLAFIVQSSLSSNTLYMPPHDTSKWLKNMDSNSAQFIEQIPTDIKTVENRVRISARLTRVATAEFGVSVFSGI